jgi:pyruvate,orthophosphate dikinase
MRVAVFVAVLLAAATTGAAATNAPFAGVRPGAVRPGASQDLRPAAEKRASLRAVRGQSLNLRGGSEKHIYHFGAGKAEGSKSLRNLLGNKGANLAEMSSLGIQVPPGFTLTTAVCEAYQKAGKVLPAGMMDEVLTAVKEIEQQTGQVLGSTTAPLLVAVRSGAAESMPGMLDTVLNIGLNDDVVKGLEASISTRFAYDTYRRFLAMFGEVVMGIELGTFEAELDAMREEFGVDDDAAFTGEQMQEVVTRFKGIYENSGLSLPTDPKQQLELAIVKVLDSWENARATEYRSINGISHECTGTAINVQAMVFGNLGQNSGTGVLFSRNPSTGENHLYGEFLLDAQGEDVVAGVRTPSPIALLESEMPEVYKDLLEHVERLEKHFGDMQDIEFTIQEKKLFMLQCRAGKRTGQAAVRIAVEMFNEGIMTKDQAISKVQERHLDQLLHPQFANEEAYLDRVLGRGLPASPGAAVGQVVFTPEEAQMLRSQGGAAILVRGDTSPEDVGGMHASEGILTQRGGMTSHAAVVARGWGKTCVVGCIEMLVDDKAKVFTLGGKTVKSGDWISLNGNTGEVILGKESLSPPILAGNLGTFMTWVDEKRRLQVYANADTPEDAAEARRNGAQGIGLVRTEHMFYSSEERLKAVRSMIMADSAEQRTEALDKLLPYQRADFEGIFRAMEVRVWVCGCGLVG